MISMLFAAAVAAAQPAPAPAMDMHAHHAEMKAGARAEECCCKDMCSKKAEDASSEATKPKS